eukprot:Phypoly_transcript_19703.p1 GENE.Phypoly_transcript_19703~~Phypoly_transcript_19703.p1  ORF type:complete len:139 (+),score=25.66 Phypoly_transcript_19703:57-473(+)
MAHCTHENCVHASTQGTQNLAEVEFARGLWTAAINGDLTRARELVKKGTNPNVTDQSGYTPLHYASRWGKKEMCEFLISTGGCVHATTTGGATPLHRAAYCNHAEIVKYLKDQGANLDAQDSDGMTPLHKASKEMYKL